MNKIADDITAAVSLYPANVIVIVNRYAAHLRRLSRINPRCNTRFLYLLRTLHAHILASGFKPRTHILNRLIDLYSKSNDLRSARSLFDGSPHLDIVGRTTLINTYFKFGDHESARKIFDATPLFVRDTVSYNSMVSGYSRANLGVRALELYKEMVGDRFIPDDYTMSSLLSAVGAIPDVGSRGCRQLHSASLKYGIESVITVSNALIALYAQSDSSDGIVFAREVFDRMLLKDELTWIAIIIGYVRCGDVDSARNLFDGMTERVNVVWNAMISGYVRLGLFSEALELCQSMYSKGIAIDEFTYTSMLILCANSGLFMMGKAVHAHIICAGLNFDPDTALHVKNVLVTMYSKCGKINSAWKVFDNIGSKDVVSWNAMLSGYVNLGSVEAGFAFFRDIPCKNMLSWTMMISCFAQNGFGDEALKLFTRMRIEEIKPSDFIFSSVISACAGLGAFELGRQIHGLLLLSGYESSNSTGNALMTMYAKCGMVEEAYHVFDIMPCLDYISWNAMIAALAQHGNGFEAIEFFKEMLRNGIHPDRITFLTILSACSHAGLVDQGLKYFDSMKDDYNIVAGEDHYARLIDLLGRAGRITEAKEVIASMPFEPGPLIWEAVLSACRIHGDLKLGIHAADQLFDMTPQHDGTYVLLSNMYAAAGMWDGVAKVRKLMKDRQIKKEPGCSWIEYGNKVHVFLVSDTNHPDAWEVHRFLEMLGAKMRKMGYSPDTKFVLHNVESEEHKEYALSTHSEKLAVGFGLLKLPAGAIIRLMKNLRICGDCHSAIIFMSLVMERKIIVRDGNRFHHFENGVCSCGNYW
ncbi:Pentatricopeptide repeat-containing protein [Zostera marina]|uniref:Pentatricopeptide repeat-containing protein n=1 Tax=Zostera marina TaxID=29655 RepID=A0A0K9PIS9_ZOSMR|nr:Pentatricopeptide repeat-containing protein [Zostera marina]